MNVCKSYELNPFTKEVWCYKDKKGNLLIFAGRDGLLRKAQENPQFNGIRSVAIYENDEYSIDVLNNKIKHTITKEKTERGKILYGVTIVFRKGGEPSICIADFSVYNKGYNAWSTHPEAMICKVSEVMALKQFANCPNVQSEYDYTIDTIGNVVVPIEQETVESKTKELLTILKDADEETRANYTDIISDKKASGELTVSILQNMINDIQS
jgi:hypothetical protein